MLERGHTLGILDGVKGKLGFGGQPEWADEPYDDEYYDDEEEFYDDEEYLDDEEPYDDIEEPYDDEADGFASYNPNGFEHIRVSTDRPLKVASLDDGGSDSYFASRVSSAGSYSSGIGTSASRSSNVRSFSAGSSRTSGSASSAGADWGAPSDPSFLDKPTPKYDRDIYDPTAFGSDPYSQQSGEFRRINDDPASHMEVVTPTAYADVEKIASAFKADKIVVLSLKATKPELAKRILDFSFGVACALNGTVDKAADRVFVITKGKALNAQETEYLRTQGLIK